MKNKKHLIKILFVLIIISSLVFIKEKTDLIEKLDNKVENFLSDNEIGKKEIKVIYENLSYDIQISFCPWQNCNKEFLYKINETKQEVKCAFYELSYEPLIKLLIEKSKFVKVDLVIDKRYKDKLNFYNLENISILTNNNSIQMHNKFCVIDNQTLITGSINPSENGFLKTIIIY